MLFGKNHETKFKCKRKINLSLPIFKNRMKIKMIYYTQKTENYIFTYLQLFTIITTIV